MKSKMLTVLIAVDAAFAALMLFVNWNGMVSYYSQWRYVFPGMLFASFILALALAASSRRHTEKRLRRRQFFTGLAFMVIPFFIFASGEIVSTYTIDRLFRSHQVALEQACDATLRNSAAMVWKESDDKRHFTTPGLKQVEQRARAMWPRAKRPEKLFVYEGNGIVFIEYIGSPHGGQGMLYNPLRKSNQEIFSVLTGSGISTNPDGTYPIYRKWGNWYGYSYVTK